MKELPRIKILAGLLILVIAVTACQTEQAPEPSATELPPSLTPTAKPSQTPEPTKTPYPTLVPQVESNCPSGGWTLYTEENGLVDNWPRTMVVEDGGRVLAGYLRGDINLLQDGVWTSLLVSPSAPWNEINTIVPLKAGDLWVGTQGGQVNLYRSGVWKMWTIQKDGVNTSVYGLEIAPDGRVWAAAWDGVFQLQGDKWQLLSKPVQEIISFTAKSLYWDNNGGLWVGGKYGIHYYKDGIWETFERFGESYYDVVDIEEFPNGVMWFATMDGVYTYDGSMWQRNSPQILSSGSDPLWATIKSLAVAPDGKIWIVVNRNEVQVYEDGSWTPVVLEEIDSESYVSQVEIDAWGALWFGTNRGVLCYLP